MMRLSIAIALLLVTTPALHAQNAVHDPVIEFSETDAEMNAAKAEAVRTLPQFFAALANPAPDESNFFLKYDIAPGGATEFIWANEIAMDGDIIKGTLANAPIAEGFKQGDRVTIARDLIVDWGYFKGAVMQGNYTTRVMLKKMPADEAAELRAALGW